ncbi:IclR family transcriptional regulator [Allostella sp. ATCC 35155]|nr:IclR family transcriptional regulator [Stella sp. ATCC 35155]
MEREAGEASGPRSLTRVMQIVAHLAAAENGATLSELARELQAPKSSLLVLLRALAAQGFASREGDRHFLGPAMYGLAAAVMARRRLPTLARPFMRSLWEATGETVILAVLKEDAPLASYIDQIESTNQVRFIARIGEERPLYCSAAGRALLAFQGEEWRERYLRTTDFRAYTPSTATDPAEIRRRLDRVRREGWSQSIAEITDGGAAVAAPVFDGEGRVVAALAVASLGERIRQNSRLYRTAAIEAARGLSQVLGHRPPVDKQRRRSPSSCE